jgi:hypothetical protein
MMRPIYLTEAQRAVLRQIRAGEELGLADCWMDVVELIEFGLIESRKADTGQLEIVGLTARGLEAVS